MTRKMSQYATSTADAEQRKSSASDTPHTTKPNLPSIISPELLQSLTDIPIPWPKSTPLSGAAVGDFYFGSGQSPAHARNVYNLCFSSVLQPLSLAGHDCLSATAADLIATCLPEASSTDFPEQALGLVLLLAQAPRAFMTGIYSRWMLA